MNLIVCEKPNVAIEFVKVFEKYTSSKFQKEQGYFHNPKGFVITYAVGHLIELAEPEDYDTSYKIWNAQVLPIIPNDFKIKVIKEKSKQYKVVEDLIRQAKTIYNATDAGREGELIFRYILEKAQENKISFMDKLIKRIWINDYEYETIVNSFVNSKEQDCAEYYNLYLSAKARSQSDWLIGINATRMLTLGTKSNFPLSLGRVQTAVLKIIVERYLKNKNFVFENLFTSSVYIKIDNNLYELVLNESYKQKSEAQIILDSTKNSCSLSVEKNEKKTRQPVLFSLIDLQIHCNKNYDFDATKTLDIAQSLYEKKFISYPRTDSNYLTTALKDETARNLEYFKKTFLQKFSSEAQEKDFIKNPKDHFIFNDDKTSDHYAIVPLPRTKYDSLNQDEQIVLNEIIKRFMQCFMEKPIIEETQIKINYNEKLFYYKNFKAVQYKGFLLLDTKAKNEKVEGFEEKSIDLKHNNSLIDIYSKQIKTGRTTAPELFTESALLLAMKNPLSHEKIEENRENIKSLGTSSTFNTYLPLLIQRKYVFFQKKYIVPTELGIKIIENLKDTKLSSISLTAEIEHQLENVRNGKLTYVNYMKAINRYTNDITVQIKNIASNISSNVEHKKDKNEAKNCPKCSTGKLYLAKSKRNYYCSNYNAENPCDFILYTNIAGRSLSEIQINDLVDKKETDVLEFKNKTGHKYKAKIVLTESFKTDMKFI